jgi:hypothetical protein
MYVQGNNEARLRNHCCSEKAIIITYSECVCVCLSIASVIQRAMPMRRITLPSVACPAIQYFSALSHKRHNFPGKKG